MMKVVNKDSLWLARSKGVCSFFMANTALQVLLAIVLVFFFGAAFSTQSKSFFYSVSDSIKQVLFFFLPIVIFSCIFNSMIANRGKALHFVLALFIAVCVSNLLSIIAGFGFGIIGLQFISVVKTTVVAAKLPKLWNFALENKFSNQQALIIGFIAGIFFAIRPNEIIINYSKKLTAIVMFFLEKVFIPILPLFAFGYLLNLQYEHSFNVTQYLPAIFLVLVISAVYSYMLFFIAAGFRIKKTWQYIKNSLPAAMVGFSTMSSLAAMPFTIKAAIKNTEKPDVVNAVIPATVNTHMMGDSIAVAGMALTILLMFGKGIPGIGQIAIFTLYFMFAKFSIAAVPGGTIFVMMPVMINYLGFTPEMAALGLSLYVLFDPIGTATNLLGNSAFVIFFAKYFKPKQEDLILEK